MAVHELALNPDSFTGRTDELILSTLAHEMAHVWQQTHGKPPRKSYHDRQWAGKMREIGLQPCSTGEEGGKETGQSVTHYIIPVAAMRRHMRNWLLQVFSSIGNPYRQASKGEQKSSKTKFTCPDCGQNAWAKPGALLICGECFDEGKGISASCWPSRRSNPL